MNGNEKIIVYATNDSGYDFTTAKDAVGDEVEIRPITVGRVNIFHTDAILRQIKFQIKEFKPEKDYLLISGSAIVAALVSSAISAEHQYPIRLLFWDHMNSKYVARTIN